MKDLQIQCPLQDCTQSKRIEVYDDELKFQSKSQKIDLVQLSSEPHRNFFLLSMEGIVYKYDLVTKELLFQFKSPSCRGLLLYDEDDKLLAADNKELRLWDFYEHREEAPQLISTIELPFEIENVYTNSICKQGKKNNPFVLVTNKNHFMLFEKRLELKFKGKCEEGGIFTSAEFHHTEKLVLGTSNGKLMVYDITMQELAYDPIRLGGESQAVTQIIAFTYIEEAPVFLVVIEDKELYLFNEKTRACRQIDFGESGKTYSNEFICNVAVQYASKFFAVGIPSKRAFGIFKIDRTSLKVTPPTEWMTKVSLCHYNY